MKNVIKKSKYQLIIFFSLIILIFIGYYNTWIYEGEKSRQKDIVEYKELCEKYLKSEPYKDERKNPYYIIGDRGCNEIIKYDTVTNDTFTTFHYLIRDNIVSFIIPFFVPLLVIFPFVFKLTKEFKSKNIKNYLLRDNYKNYKKHIFKEGYKNLWTMPLLIIVTFVMSYMISGHFDNVYNCEIVGQCIGQTYQNESMSYVFFILIIFLNVGIYINVGITVLSKNKNFWIALIESFLLVYFLWVFNEYIANVLYNYNYIIKSEISYFNLVNIYNLPNVDNYIWPILISLFYFVLSLVIAVISYKNKENFIIMCEK